ncbi:MAG: 50S ribosomal protein L10 [Candidatus Omnitrophica bacterium]|nr:50S ribosomal protein L10 [Candidatus Omnitrophota bacterium]
MKRVGQIYRSEFNNRIRQGIESNESCFILSFSKLSSKTLSNLRKDLQKSGASMFVSKNSIAQNALEELKHEGLINRVSDQTAFVWTNADSSAVSKVLINFSKDLEHVKVKGGLLSGRVLLDTDVKRLSELPSREVLLSMLLGTLQAPASRLAGALNAKSRELLSILKQYSEKKGGN